MTNQEVIDALLEGDTITIFDNEAGINRPRLMKTLRNAGIIVEVNEDLYDEDGATRSVRVRAKRHGCARR